MRYAIASESGFEIRFGGVVPEGALPLSEEQYQSLTDGSHTLHNGEIVPYVAPVYAPTALEQIAAIEAANPITHRNLRDLSMTVAQIAAAVTNTDPMVNPAVQQIALLQTTIDALREQARAQGLIP